MSFPSPLLLGLELSGTGAHPASWRRPDSRAEELFDAAYWVDALLAADTAGIDFAFLTDSFALQAAGAVGRLDAVAVAARAAAATRHIGLIAQVAVTHTEPFHLSKAIASLDFASHGRAGWEVTVSTGAATLFGRKAEQDSHSRWFEADETVEVAARLWDSWEDDAEIRDQVTGRFIDRDRLHYIDFVGDNFSVKGPSITPRPPQGQPLVTVRADSAHSTRVAVHRADLIRIAAPDLATAAGLRAELRGAVAAAGRDPDQVRILLDLDVHLADTIDAAAADVAQLEDWIATPAPGSVFHIGTAGELRDSLADVETQCAADGVVLRPLALPAVLPQLSALAAGRAPRPGTLRERLGLPRPTSRYTHA